MDVTIVNYWHPCEEAREEVEERGRSRERQDTYTAERQYFAVSEYSSTMSKRVRLLLCVLLTISFSTHGPGQKNAADLSLKNT